MDQQLHARPAHRQMLRCSPQQIAFVETLALPAAALGDLIAAELDANPALELTDGCGACRAGLPCACGDTAAVHGPLGPAMRTDPAAGSGIDGIAMPPARRAELLADLTRSVPTADHPVVAAVLAALDDRGFLDEPPHLLAVRLGVAQARIDRALAAIRAITSPGVGAAGPREHLILEVRALDVEPAVRQLAERILADHLELLADDDLRTLTGLLDRSEPEVRSACALIRERVRPWPAINLEPADAGSCSGPELAVEQRQGTLTVRVLEAERWNLRVHAGLRRAVADGAEHVPAALAATVGRAARFVDRVEQRWRTMRTVAEAVVAHQRGFVLEGPKALVPLMRADVAAEVGVHESTVSRTVRDRHVALPDGRVVPFAAFFEAAQATREALRELIATERTPLSDAQLVEALADRGHKVARRTVVKYRRQLGIASSRQRARTRNRMRAT